MGEANIVLTGFMGAGKTSVGREIASRLGRQFIDLDDMIVQRAGKSISAIFKEDGEPRFRELEAAACAALSTPAGLIVATGGGAVLAAGNREALMAGGKLICLDADPEAIVRRLAGGNGRPLLSGGAKKDRVEELLAERHAAYATIPDHVDTTRLNIRATAERVMAVVGGLPDGGYRLPIRHHLDRDELGSSTQAERSLPMDYDVLIANGLLAEAGKRIAGAGLRPGRCAIVTNPTVGGHHTHTLRDSLAAAGFEPVVIEMPDGEQYKTLETAGALFHQLAEAKLSRGEPIIALGGGVVGDVAGFLAASWLRGVPFVQIPTSLLAMVDASVGGKVAVDLPQGKNLVGAFKNPEIVLIDPNVLSTLPGAEFRSGLAEVLKGAIIGAPALFEQLAGSGPTTLVEMVADAVRVKIDVVERDPFEQDDRAWLNLGHTFGHALEKISGYALRHGDAVALGTIAASEMSAAMGLCEHTLPVRVRRASERLGLPSQHSFDISAAIDAMGTDKKRRGRSLRFVLPVRIGSVRIVDGVDASLIREAFGKISE